MGLGPTESGSKHDKTCVDEQGYTFPKGSTLFQDTGFQGYAPEGRERGIAGQDNGDDDERSTRAEENAERRGVGAISAPWCQRIGRTIEDLGSAGESQDNQEGSNEEGKKEEDEEVEARQIKATRVHRKAARTTPQVSFARSLNLHF